MSDDATTLPATGSAPRHAEAIQAAIDEMRPFLKADGGDCELVGIEGDRVLIRMKGACVGCRMASVTINGIQERLIARTGRPLRVIPAPPGR